MYVCSCLKYYYRSTFRLPALFILCMSFPITRLPGGGGNAWEKVREIRHLAHYCYATVFPYIKVCHVVICRPKYVWRDKILTIYATGYTLLFTACRRCSIAYVHCLVVSGRFLCIYSVYVLHHFKFPIVSGRRCCSAVLASVILFVRSSIRLSHTWNVSKQADTSNLFHHLVILSVWFSHTKYG